MTVASAVVAALHFLGLGIGLPAVFLRGRALKGRLDADGVGRVLTADTAWGVAAALWIATGLLRAFAGLEKGSAYYLASPLFWTKMGLFIAVLGLEVRPMLAFIGWRRDRARGLAPDTRVAPTLYAINHVELALLVVMLFVASF